MIMWKAISGVLVGICLASSQAMAVDATWYCSTIFEGAKEATTLKFEVKGGELFALTHVGHILKYLRTKYGKGTKEPTPEEYKIVEDTEKSLIAIYNYPYSEKDHTSIDLVLIDKESGKLRQSLIFRQDMRTLISKVLVRRESEFSNSRLAGTLVTI
jgi:hypothetical protein